MQFKASTFILGLLLGLLITSLPLQADDMIVKKNHFTTHHFNTFNGNTIDIVNVGWEAYGELNKNKDNAILITHYFSGNSHAAGKYHPSDPQAGYWDSIIGPGKAIDTNRYYVISVDTLANLSFHDPKVITTGPASINPKTGKPYGLSFPVVTIRDFVNVQKAVLDSLGIDQLHAVVGASMGAMQALDWAIAYPDSVPRMISVIGAGQSDAWTTTSLEHWATPIKLDVNWQAGNYYGETTPKEGLIASLMLVTQYATHPEFINASNPHHNQLQKAPLNSISASYDAVKWLKERATARANVSDANHLLYLVRASQSFIGGFNADFDNNLAKVKAKSLFIPASNDLLLMPYQAQRVHKKLLALGKTSTLLSLSPDSPTLGHLDGIANIAVHEKAIRHFLASEAN
jgi:homoserine O-acetyltransferase